MDDRRHFLFLNIGHFLDHLFLLIFATAAALTLASEWALSYGDLIPYATPGLIAFGVFSLPAVLPLLGAAGNVGRAASS